MGGTLRGFEKLKDKRMLFFTDRHLICVDIGKLVDGQSSANSASHIPTLTKPVLWDLGLFGRFNAGGFVHNNNVFVIGGFGNGVCLLDVCAVNKLDTTRIRTLNSPKTIALVETIGHKVYVLDKWYEHPRDLKPFEFLDLDSPSLSWEALPFPSFLPKELSSNPKHTSDMFLHYHSVVIHCCYVVGLRLYVLGCSNEHWNYGLGYFDTETNQWFDVCQINVTGWMNDFELVKGTVTLQCEQIVVLHYRHLSDDVVLPKLYATLVTESWRPVCYQDILNCVFRDILPNNARILGGGAFNIGDGLICALLGGVATAEEKDNHFIAMSFFELSFNIEYACEPDDETPYETSSLLNVKVYDMFIGWTEYSLCYFRSAFIL